MNLSDVSCDNGGDSLLNCRPSVECYCVLLDRCKLSCSGTPGRNAGQTTAMRIHGRGGMIRRCRDWMFMSAAAC